VVFPRLSATAEAVPPTAEDFPRNGGGRSPAASRPSTPCSGAGWTGGPAPGSSARPGAASPPWPAPSPWRRPGGESAPPCISSTNPSTPSACGPRARAWTWRPRRPPDSSPCARSIRPSSPPASWPTCWPGRSNRRGRGWWSSTA
jgi:hypothetical protein